MGEGEAKMESGHNFLRFILNPSLMNKGIFWVLERSESDI